MKKHKYYYRDRISIVVKDVFKKMILRALKYNVNLSKSVRQRAMNKLTIINLHFNMNRLKKFCLVTGRLRFIINDSKFSRIVFRKNVSNKFLVGYSKNA